MTRDSQPAAISNWAAWAMVLPTVIVLSVLVLFPLVQGIYQSFTNLNEGNKQDTICTKTLGGGEECMPNPRKAEVVGLKNYVDVLSGERGRFWQQFTNTVVWTAACVFFHYTIGLSLAVLLHRRFKGRSLYRVLLIVPWAVPSFVSAFAWKFMFPLALANLCVTVVAVWALRSFAS